MARISGVNRPAMGSLGSSVAPTKTVTARAVAAVDSVDSTPQQGRRGSRGMILIPTELPGRRPTAPYGLPKTRPAFTAPFVEEDLEDERDKDSNDTSEEEDTSEQEEGRAPSSYSFTPLDEEKTEA